METTQKSNTGLKVGLGILLVLFFVTAFVAYNFYNENKETEKTLTAEKEQIMTDLQGMRLKLDESLEDNTIVSQDLSAAKQRIVGLIDSLKQSQTSVNNLFAYRKKFLAIQKEMDVLLKENDRLKVENQLLTTSLDSTKVQLAERTSFTDSLLVQNSELANVVKDASALQTVGLNGLGIIERSNGKQIPTERARRTDKIKVCFTVAKNNLADAGDKAFYVQVIDANNNVLGSKAEVKFDDKVLKYSLVSRFNYENKNLNICEYLASDNKKFEAGRYIVNVFNGKDVLSTSEFVLR